MSKPTPGQTNIDIPWLSKSMTANERQQKRRDAMRKKGLVKREVWIDEKYSEALAEFVKCLK
tara:strand:+ start:1586 stop:1771 length:186 start_codon:yes stop_codon:yes gene_type:complete